MKATIVDLRYKMKQVLTALDKGERITVLYHGKEKATIVPVASPPIKKVEEHKFFNMSADDTISVKKTVDLLREGRS